MKNSKEILNSILGSGEEAYNWGGAYRGLLNTSSVLLLYLGGEFISAYIIIVVIKTEHMCFIHFFLGI